MPWGSRWDDLINIYINYISFERPEKFLENHRSLPERSGWDDFIYHLNALPRRSGWEISDTKIGAETKLLPALCPVANLAFRIVFSIFKNLFFRILFPIFNES